MGTNSNNPLGTCVLDCFSDGVEAYFAFRNSQGGIFGGSRERAGHRARRCGRRFDYAAGVEMRHAFISYAAFAAVRSGCGK